MTTQTITVEFEAFTDITAALSLTDDSDYVFQSVGPGDIVMYQGSALPPPTQTGLYLRQGALNTQVFPQTTGESWYARAARAGDSQILAVNPSADENGGAITSAVWANVAEFTGPAAQSFGAFNSTQAVMWGVDDNTNAYVHLASNVFTFQQDGTFNMEFVFTVAANGASVDVQTLDIVFLKNGQEIPEFVNRLIKTTIPANDIYYTTVHYTIDAFDAVMGDTLSAQRSASTFGASLVPTIGLFQQGSNINANSVSPSANVRFNTLLTS